jgi:hypothetical protein
MRITSVSFPTGRGDIRLQSRPLAADNIGSADDDAGMELLKAAARQRLPPVRASWTWDWRHRARRAWVPTAANCRSPARGWVTCGCSVARL